MTEYVPIQTGPNGEPVYVSPEKHERTEALKARVQAAKDAALARGYPDDHDALLSDESYFLAIFDLNAWRWWDIDTTADA